MNWILSENTLILRHCPRWLLVPWLVSCLAWWFSLILYPLMAETAFGLWWALCWKSFAVAAALTIVCIAWARWKAR